MVKRRGDNIPPISDYAHWNEDAYYMWYEENKYDMMYADEIIEDDDDDRYDDYEMDEDVDEEFDNRKDAEVFYEMMAPMCVSITMTNMHWKKDGANEWYNVHGTSTKYYNEQVKRTNRHSAEMRRR